MVGEVGGPESGKDAEGEVEGADECLCRESHEAVGSAEVGEQPERVGGEGRCYAGDEGLEFGFGEAIEEEVGDNEVVRTVKGVGEGVGVMGAEACGGVWACGFAALAEEFEHHGAGVYGIGVEL